MEILILLKANILRKKGTFAGILILTAIITAVMTTVFSVKDNYNTAADNSIEYSDSGDILTIIRPELYTEQLRSKVEGHKLVERVVCYDAICGNGMKCGEQYDENSQFMLKMHDGIRLINESEDGYVDEIPELKSGEIYLPLGLKEKLECGVGDTIKIYLFNEITEEFKIMGFVEEITQGSMNIGWKQIFISNEDYEKILEICRPLTTEDTILEVKLLMIHKADDCSLSASKFQRQLNLDTGIISSAIGTLNIDQSVNYTTILTDVVMDVVTAFAIFLFIIVLIVISHSIGTEIEIDYTTLGVLKSQGFTEGKIRVLFIFQYILAQVFGIIVGNIAAIPLERKISSVCQKSTGIIPQTGLSIGKCLIFAGAIIAVSAALIFIKTIKVSKISPVRAISGGQEDIFFDSRINLPIVKKTLSASLSFRQFTSAKKRYFGTIFIVSILNFCMITVNLIGNILSSRNAQEAMGVLIPDLTVYLNKSDGNIGWEEVDKLVEECLEIKEKNSYISLYASLNGENLYCEMYENPEYVSGIIKGRAPLYENEIVITEIVADLLDIETGDQVTVTFKNKENPYIVSGIYQSGRDVGMSFCMSFDGAKRNGETAESYNRYYIFADKSQTDMVSEKIYEKYGDLFYCDVYDDSDITMSEYNEIVSLLKVIIYGFSILFALVVIRMVVQKSFIQERRVIGIYKAVGFTSDMLRLQFAIRFFIISVTGSVIGVILSIAFSEKTLELLLSLIGFTKVAVEYTPITVILPIVAVCICFFVFSFAASWKIKRVEIRELVVE